MSRYLTAHRNCLAMAAGLLVLVMAMQGQAGPPEPEHSVARQWNEAMLTAIRNDFARPTVHARNLYHVSAAMWDAWAAYDSEAQQVIHHEKATAMDIQAAREEAISYAAYRVLKARFGASPGAPISIPVFDQLMNDLGYDPGVRTTVGASPAALGNRVGVSVLAHGLSDGANEANGYANQHYSPVNPPLVPGLPGNPDLVDPNRWQPLALDFFIDQSGNVIIGGFPPFLSPEWGIVTPFSLTPDDANVVPHPARNFDWWLYHDPGAPPQHNGENDHYYRWGFEQVAIWSSHLDPSDGVMWDVSPGGIGNAPLPDVDQFESFYDLENGGDWGTGYDVNPVTGLPYEPQLVPRGDYTRILAEFWADGPQSETPPGHWFTILNYVNDHPLFEHRFGGEGPVLDSLEWDVKAYLIMGGAMHDVAVTVWGLKGYYDFIRPVSAIRYLADEGQSSDPLGPSYDPDGIRLYPGLIEVITEETITTYHAHLAGEKNENLGKIAIRAWRGPDFIANPQTDVAGVGWILAENWWPYQRPTFVTPPFAGYVSGHSTFSRAAAQVMTLLTGSEYFPGGLGEFQCPQNEFLVFEEGPSMNVTLQWARYMDASDQCSLSRIWGGIHPGADDIPGRHIGNVIGPEAFNFAVDLFGGLDDPADFNGDGFVNAADLAPLLGAWSIPAGSPGCGGALPCAPDLNDDGFVNAADLAILLGSWTL